MKLTNEQKEANKLTRAEAKRTARALAKIEAEMNQKPINEIRFSIEWKKSRMWGHNPHLNATAYHKDGSSTDLFFTCSGCGYDKESEVIALAFNELLKYKLYQFNEADQEKMPYGIRIGEYKSFSGGIGANCYYKIAEAINGKFEKVASGKTYDAYKYTDIN
jgi:hypothetical protein